MTAKESACGGAVPERTERSGSTIPGAVVGSGMDHLLARLSRVKRTGSARYQARCPAHDDKGPSLSVRELEDGRVLIHCFAGCDVHSILSAIDLDISALFPPREIAHARPERHPFPALDVLRAIAFEALVVAAAAMAVLDGRPLQDIDRHRLVTAVSRIQSALELVEVNHE